MKQNRKSSGQVSYRQNHRENQRETDAYVYGNAVRKTEPQRIWEEDPRKEEAVRKSHHKVQKNREKARYMNAGYVMFLAAALCAAAWILVNYIQMQADLTNLTKSVAEAESTLDRLRVSNDEEYNRILSSIDLEEIKRIAITELGMVYAQEGQVVEYEGESGDYMRQVIKDKQ